MIDIIIPAYNSHDTIVRTLNSIQLQLNLSEIMVTIVNDGGDSYGQLIKANFPKATNIREIGYEKNMGPGYARQYGLDHTEGEFVTFIDADDTFYGATAVALLAKVLRDTPTKFVVSPFYQYGREIGQRQRTNANLVWVFGHMYRRAFLNQHNIRFTPTRANEDVGFNSMCNLIAQHEIGEGGGKMLNVPTYEWHYNQASITRRGKSEYEYGICTPGYIYNCHNAYDVAQREGVTLKELAKPALETAFSCFIYYNVALQQDGLPAETLEGIEELARKFYYAYYKQIQDYISRDEYKKAYTSAMNGKAPHLNGVIFKMTLDQFIELMFSKEPNDKDYLEIEQSVQKVAENR